MVTVCLWGCPWALMPPQAVLDKPGVLGVEPSTEARETEGDKPGPPACQQLVPIPMRSRFPTRDASVALLQGWPRLHGPGWTAHTAHPRYKGRQPLVLLWSSSASDVGWGTILSPRTCSPGPWLLPLPSTAGCGLPQSGRQGPSVLRVPVSRSPLPATASNGIRPSRGPASSSSKESWGGQAYDLRPLLLPAALTPWDWVTQDSSHVCNCFLPVYNSLPTADTYSFPTNSGKVLAAIL